MNTSTKGTGSIRQLPSGKYNVRVSCGLRRDGSRNVISRTCDTLQEAELTRMRLVIESGQMPNIGDDMTLDEYYYSLFVPGRVARGLAKSTLADYESHYKNHIQPVFGSRGMSTIKHAEIQALINGMTYTTAQHTVKTLRAILRSAWNDELLDVEPMRKTLHYPKPNKQRGVWTVEQVAQALELMQGTPFEALWLVMVGAGLRKSEAYALFWSDLEFQPVQRLDGETGYFCTVTVDDAYTRVDGRKAVKTDFSTRTVVCAEPFAKRLHELKKEPETPICALSLGRIIKGWRDMWKEPPKTKHGKEYKFADSKYYVGRFFNSGIPYVQMSRMRATHETIMQAVGVSDTLNARMHGRAEFSTVGYTNYLNPDIEAFNAASGAFSLAISDAQKRQKLA